MNVFLSPGGFPKGSEDGRGGVSGPSGVLQVLLAAGSCGCGTSGKGETSGNRTVYMVVLLSHSLSAAVCFSFHSLFDRTLPCFLRTRFAGKTEKVVHPTLLTDRPLIQVLMFAFKMNWKKYDCLGWL